MCLLAQSHDRMSWRQWNLHSQKSLNAARKSNPFDILDTPACLFSMWRFWLMLRSTLRRTRSRYSLPILSTTLLTSSPSTLMKWGRSARSRKERRLSSHVFSRPSLYSGKTIQSSSEWMSNAESLKLVLLWSYTANVTPKTPRSLLKWTESRSESLNQSSTTTRSWSRPVRPQAASPFPSQAILPSKPASSSTTAPSSCP